jgi:hypothetical protein
MREAERTHGRPHLLALRQDLRAIVQPDVGMLGVLDQAVEQARKLATPWYLAYNPGVAAKQLFSIPNFIAEMGGAVRGMATFADGLAYTLQHMLNWSARSDMFALSPYMKKRSEGAITRDMRASLESIRAGGWGRGLKYAQELGFLPIKIADGMATTPMWWGAYRRSMRENPEGSIQDHVRFADKAIASTQPSAREIDLTPMQRSRHGAARLLTMFGGFRIMHGNQIAMHFRRWQQRGGFGSLSASGEFVAFMAEVAVLPPILMGLMFRMLWNRDEDEQEPLWPNVVNTTAGGFPGVAELTRFAVAKAQGNTFRAGISSPAVDTVDSLANATWDAGGAALALPEALERGDEDELVEITAQLMQVPSILARVPLSRVVEETREGWRQWQDEDATLYNVLDPDWKQKER